MISTCPHRTESSSSPSPASKLLDVTGPAEVFSVASRVAGEGRPGYQVQIATADGGDVRTSSGVRLMSDLTLEEVDGRVDTLLVSGAVTQVEGSVEAVVDMRVTAWLRGPGPGPAGSGRSVPGAHLMAAAGLLDGLRPRPTGSPPSNSPPSTRRSPSTRTRSSSGQGGVWTCAGITSGMDMALAMVAEDHGQASRPGHRPA